ncbi:MAG: hypothetical protein NVS4B11_09250 [Ktedonobacteraceae bacterium]
MSRTNITHKPLHFNCHIKRLLMLVGVLCAVCLLQVQTVAYADGVPGGNVTDSVIRAVDIAKPAVVRIITDIPSKLTVHFSQTNSVTFPQAGDPYPLELSGSGAFISGHGDILTADHVVNPPHDQALSQGLEALASQDIATYISQHGSQQVTKDQVFQALQSNQIASDPQYGTTMSEALFSTAYTGPLTATTFRDLPKESYATVDTIKKQSPVEQKDVAIIHVPLDDTPSILLGDSTAVQQQDELTIIGFPGNGDVGNSPTSILSSSINKVIVSSLKTKDNGAPVIQVGGNVEHGDSGGPALNGSGKIVGVVSFGTADPNSPGSTSFLQASSSAQELIQALNLDTTPGAFQKAWSQAFADYASNTAGHWHRAQAGFSQVQSRYPQFKAIAPYLSYAQTQAKNEPTTPSSPIHIGGTPSIPALAWTIGALTLIAFLALLIVAIGFGRRGKKGAAAASSVAQGYSAQPSQITPLQPGLSMQHSQRNNTSVPNIPPAYQTYRNGLAAFGGPQPSITPYQTQTPASQQPSIGPTTPALQVPMGQQAAAPDTSGVLRPWPCGHLNRSNARFCSICGEPAPTPPTSSTFIRRFEQ